MAGNHLDGSGLSLWNRLEIAMRAVTWIVAAAVLAGTLAGCADPYYGRYGYSQSYAYSTSPAVAVAYYPTTSYTTYPAYTYPTGYTYNSARWDYYRNYNGIHPGPEYYP
jgi:hypothetical protein